MHDLTPENAITEPVGRHGYAQQSKGPYCFRMAHRNVPRNLTIPRLCFGKIPSVDVSVLTRSSLA